MHSCAAGLGGALERGELELITIPASAIIAALTYWAVNLIPLAK